MKNNALKIYDKKRRALLQNANIIISNEYNIVQLVDLKEIFTGSITTVI